MNIHPLLKTQKSWFCWTKRENKRKRKAPITENLKLSKYFEEIYCLQRYLLDILDKRYSIGGVMVRVLSSSLVDRGFESWSGQIKDYKIGICCFSAKHAALRRKSKDWLARNQDHVSEWVDLSIGGLLSQWASTVIL
jgi:hypothetical protein